MQGPCYPRHPTRKGASIPTAYAGGHGLKGRLYVRPTTWPWSDPQNECHPVLDTHDTRSYHFWAVMLEDLGHLLTLWGLHGAPGARLEHDLN